MADHNQGGGRRRQKRAWWRRPWIVPLVLVCAVFIAFSAPPYFMFDYREVATIEFRPGIEPFHYSLVALHVTFGIVALTACCLQVWPWFRKRYPVVHRWVGRTYVFGGVLPAAFFGIFTSVLHVQGLNAQLGNLVLVTLWAYTTLCGYRTARARNFAEHRKWMIRSFALCFSIVLNRAWVAITIPIALFLDPTYETEQAALASGIGAAVWLSWVVNLLVAEWCLQYRGKAKARGVRPKQTGEPSSQKVPAQVS